MISPSVSRFMTGDSFLKTRLRPSLNPNLNVSLVKPHKGDRLTALGGSFENVCDKIAWAYFSNCF